MAVEDDTQSARLPAVEVAMATKFNFYTFFRLTHASSTRLEQH